MICTSVERPTLEIPDHVWARIEHVDFVNFPVPLLNPIFEFEGRVYWNGTELLRVSPTLAAFARFDEAASRMPYDEMFRVIESPDRSVRAQIYSVFFEKDAEGTWNMIYRLMNASRLLMSTPSSLPGWFESDLPTVNWMLTATEPYDWLGVDDFVRFFCPAASLDGDAVMRTVRCALATMLGPCSLISDARVRPTDNGLVELVPMTSRCCGVLLDVRRGEAAALLAMDDPEHLVSRFWRLSSKIFVDARDRLEMRAISSDAWHFAQAASAARASEDSAQLTAASFYC